MKEEQIFHEALEKPADQRGVFLDAACAGDADCLAGYVCSKLPGSSQVGFCQPAPPGGLPNGSACGDDSQCASTVCTGTCTPTCLSEAYCPGAAQTCAMVGDLSAGFITGACMNNAPGTIQNGL